VSKLETARQTPSSEDIFAWTRATNSESHAEDLLSALHTLEEQHAEWQRVLKHGLRSHQQTLSELDGQTRLFRVFETTVIPGLLQTAEYARARMAQGVMLYNSANDIDLAVKARMQRQELLYQGNKRFHFVVTEAALRLRLSPLPILLNQLDRLVSLSTLPNVRFGVIHSATQYLVGPWHGFWICDQERVLVETFSAELNLMQPPEITLYSKVFEHFATIARYGRSSREIITRVADDLIANSSSESNDS
jgi:hypothetical protein